MFMVLVCVFFFKQKTAYEVRISDWSSDVCSSDLPPGNGAGDDRAAAIARDIRSAGRDLGAAGLRRRGGGFCLRLLIVHTSRHFLLIKLAFPREVLLREYGLGVCRRAFGGDLRRVPGLDHCKSLSRLQLG